MIGPGGIFVPYADIHLHDNVVATVINTADKPHLVQGLFAAEFLNGFSFSAGSTGAITDTADNGSGKLRITSAAHGLSTGAILTSTDLTTLAQNNITNVTVIDPATFDCDDISFVTGSETGTWYEGDKLTALKDTAGKYQISFHTSGTPAAVIKIFEFEIFKNEIPQEHIESIRSFATNDIGSIGDDGIIEIAEGDIITLAIFCVTDTTNFTMSHTNIALHRFSR